MTKQDTSVKFIGDGKVGGYLVVFGDVNTRDLQGEYFTKDTEFNLDWYEVRPALYHHGLDGELAAAPVGKINNLKVDKVGIWAEAQLDMHKEYVEAVNKLVKKGILHWSSGSLAHLVEVTKDGQIKKWPIVEGSLTPTPAEPRKTDIHSIKSAYAELGLDTSKLSIPAQARKDASNEHKDAIADETSKIHEDTENIDEENIMPEELMALLESMQAQLSEIAANMGASDPEKVAEEVVDEIKAEDDDMKEIPEDEKAKAFAEKAMPILTRIVEKQLKMRDDAKKTLSEAAKAYGKNVKTQQPLGAYTGNDPNKADSRIQVGDNLRTAHLSASDMALAVVMRTTPAKSQGIPVRLENYFDEPFFKEMAHKMHLHADSEPYTKTRRAQKSGYHMDLGSRANYHVKSTIPFKADELNAAVITGQGAEWVAEWWSTDLWERERFATHYDTMVSKGMQVQMLPQGVDIARFSTEGADPIAYVAGEARSTDATGRPETTLNINPFATGTVSITPKEIKIATSTTTVLEEDSIINVVTQVNRQLSEKALATRDQLMVNGDNSTGTTNINSDGTAPATGLSTPYYIASDGFRLVGLANGRDASNVLNLAQYRLTLEQMDGELRQFYDRMVFMIDPQTEMASLAITEIATDDVRRTMATVTSGRLLNIHGIDVLVNGWIPQTDTDGKVTGTGNVSNRGSILLNYAPYWGVAWKRQTTLETARDIYSGSNIYVMSMRLGFIERGTNASALSYNVATTAT